MQSIILVYIWNFVNYEHARHAESPPTPLLTRPTTKQDAECTLSVIPRGVAKNVVFVSRDVNKKRYCYTTRLPRGAEALVASAAHHTSLVGDPPAIEPLEVAPLLVGADHTE